MVFVRSSLGFWFLGAVVVGIVASPVNQFGAEEALLRRRASPSFTIDWKMIDQDVHSLLSLFQSELGASRTSVTPPTPSPTPSSSPTSVSSVSSPTSSHSTSTSSHSTSTSSHSTSFSSSSTSTTSSHSTSTISSHSTSPTPPHSTSTPTTSQTTPVPTSTHPITTTTSTTSTHSTTTTTRPSSSSPTSPQPTSTASSSSKPTSQSPTKPTTTSSSSSPGSTGSPIKAPRFVVYADEVAFGFPTPAQIMGFNILILSFLLIRGPADMALAWQELSDSQRASMKANYQDNGISMMVSALGSTETPTTLNVDPVDLANQVATWAIKFGMDGVDVDYEDFNAVAAGTAVNWLVQFTTTLRSALPANMVISHAPVAPWIGPKQQPYTQLEQKVGGMIDWYNIQFYSQGTAYTTCDTLVSASGGSFPGTSVLEMIQGGVPASKVVIGKPAALIDVGVSADILEFGEQHETEESPAVGASPRVTRRSTSPPNTNGFIDPSVLAQCLVTAAKSGWNAGVMMWEYPDGGAEWIQQVRSLAFPLNN